MIHGIVPSRAVLRRATRDKGGAARWVADMDSRTYHSWYDMLRRCCSSKSQEYRHYGGRGIRVCDRWSTFALFLEDMGESPPGMTIERIDTNGNYEPGNCRWATLKEQANNRRSNVHVTIGDKTLTLAQWADYTGIPRGTVKNRYNKGFRGAALIGPRYARK